MLVLLWTNSQAKKFDLRGDTRVPDGDRVVVRNSCVNQHLIGRCGAVTGVSRRDHIALVGHVDKLSAYEGRGQVCILRGCYAS